ncbi:epimerase [Lutimaribacter sp. EGI FJ00015]|uniref:Epimerase n=1 Tax=Lutimaribacter degradans TaxID=2945989 RepID=A0ACC5ZTA7_9RHOB|nr:epimerase [Lutimaribacter sp. EGI FJ00013]MCM2561574.1 epimerase [Lutimaribacter sp. EGI FJ00013]MCO0612715.1 epimerase [Lutimaribacter sp. EGI FJ00015]MCO0635373.1 epimerase [Lutimaribacter sp. EGI FJ00014]
MTGTILVLGATGRFGRNIADAFARAGWRVRCFDRSRDDLDRVAKGADVIAMGWNPRYHRWAAEMPGLHAAVRRAALRHDCTVLLPGNVYVFGQNSGPVWDQDTPHRATNPLGRLRIEMEAAYRTEGVRTIVLRAGDFLDTEASGNWFDALMAKRIGRGILRYPGARDVPHAWAFLPDLARAFVALAETRAQLPQFADIPFPGYTLTGYEMADALARVTGQPVQVRPVRWGLLRMARPVMPFIGGLLEMRYLWSLPHRLDGARFAEVLPGFQATPLDEALTRTIAPLR